MKEKNIKPCMKIEQTCLSSTLRLISPKKPNFIENSPTVAKYFSYPKNSAKRTAEGGIRLEGKYKQSHTNFPLISIITVCLNAAHTIEQTLLSVFCQEYNNIEYIVIDGASNDKSLDIIEKYKDKIDYYLSETDDGLYYAINKGLSLASGEYILILNADDTYTTDAVSSLVRAMQNEACDFVSAHAYFICKDESKNFTFNKIYYNPAIRLFMPIRHETALISAQIYNEFGFYDTRYNIISDWVFCKKLYDAKKTMYELKKTILNFSTQGISYLQTQKREEERFYFLQESFSFLEQEDLQILAKRDELNSENFFRILAKYSRYFDFTEAMRADPLLAKYTKLL